MPTLPSAASFTGSTVTEAQFKTSITDLREFLATLLGTAGTQQAALAAMGGMIAAVNAKSAAYTVVTGDRGKLIDCTTGTWSLGLVAAATAGAGFAFAVRNSGSGSITLDPDGTEQIDGASTLALAAGESCVVVCDGAGWKTVGRSGGNGRLLRVTRYSTAGSGTWNKPTDVNAVRIRAVGGGGAGGGNIGAMLNGGGGGGGGYTEKWIASPSASYAYVVGAGGTSSHNTQYGIGGNGGNTTIAGMTAGGGNAALSTYYLPATLGGAGGTATGGDVNIPGDYGHEDGAYGRGGDSALGRGGIARAGAYLGVRGGGGAGNIGQPNTGGAGYIEIEEYA